MAELTNDLVALIRALIARTEEGKLNWSESRPGQFLLQRSAGAIGIASADEDGAGPFRLFLYDSDGTIKEVLEAPTPTSPEFLDGALEALYSTVRRASRNIDPLIRSLLEEVNAESS